MARSMLTISVKVGRSDGSADQHCSISRLQCGSHESGTGGRRVSLTIPPGLIVHHIMQLPKCYRKNNGNGLKLVR
jgi:hypothetical protein